MIGKLTGKLDGIHDGGCILDVNGVGYLVAASSRRIFSWSRSRGALSFSLSIGTSIPLGRAPGVRTSRGFGVLVCSHYRGVDCECL